MSDLIPVKLLSCSLAVVLMGSLISYLHGIGLFVFAPNLLAIGVGVIGYSFLRKKADFILKNSFSMACTAVFLILLTLFTQGLDSVHRWLPLGSMRLNVSMILTPLVLFHVHEEGSLRSFVLALILSCLFVLQPDAGQASAFAFAMGVICYFCHELNRPKRQGSMALIAVLTIAAWMRPDALLPVAHVERIFHLAYEQGLLLFLSAIASIGLLFYPFFDRDSRKDDSPRFTLLITFVAYFVGCFVVTEIGYFPVPVIGAGASPVLGWFLMLGILHSKCKKIESVNKYDW